MRAKPCEFRIPSATGLQIALASIFISGGIALKYQHGVSNRSATRELQMIAEFNSTVDEIPIDSLTKWLEESKVRLPFVMFEKMFDGTSHKPRVCQNPKRKNPMLAITSGKVEQMGSKRHTCTVRRRQMPVNALVSEISFTWLLPNCTTPFIVELTLPPSGLPGNRGGGAK